MDKIDKLYARRQNGYLLHLVKNPPIVRMDRTVEYCSGSALFVPRRPGVYLIHDLRGVLYAGRSEDLGRRYDEHFWENSNPLLAFAMAHHVGVLRFTYRKTVAISPEEQELIRVFEPPCNRLLYRGR